jgi:hypothetical protein
MYTRGKKIGRLENAKGWSGGTVVTKLWYLLSS